MRRLGAIPRATGMAILALCGLGLPLCTALAHGTRYRDLGGRTLCLDDRSVQVRIHDGAAPDPATYAAAVDQRLHTELRTTLHRFQVPFRERERCGDLFTRIHFELRISQDARGRSFHWVEISLQIGRPPPDADEAGADLGDLRFGALFTDAVFPPGEGEDFFAAQFEHGSELIEDLAVAWWEDRALRSTAPPWLPPLGAALALVVAVAALRLARRVRRERRKGKPAAR